MGRRRRTDLWDGLFESLRWLFTIIHPAWSILLAAVFFFGSLAWFRYKVTIQGLEVFAYLFGGVPAMVSLAAGFVGWQQRKERARFFSSRVDLERIRGLSWQEFERRVADVYRHQGYRVDEVGGGGADGGVDLRLHRAGRTTLVQCKQWRVYKVGVKPVRELFGVAAAERAEKSILITSGVYTTEARHFAEGKPIELIEGEQLARMLGEVQETHWREPERTDQRGEQPPATAPVPATAGADALPACPQCGSVMALRRAKRGTNAGNTFWGCSQYPRCRGIRPVRQPA